MIFKTIKILFMEESTEGFSVEQSQAMTREDFVNEKTGESPAGIPGCIIRCPAGLSEWYRILQKD